MLHIRLNTNIRNERFLNRTFVQTKKPKHSLTAFVEQTNKVKSNPIHLLDRVFFALPSQDQPDI